VIVVIKFDPMCVPGGISSGTLFLGVFKVFFHILLGFEFKFNENWFAVIDCLFKTIRSKYNGGLAFNLEVARFNISIIENIMSIMVNNG